MLAIANQKGGVGKTTTTVTLAGLLASSGQRILLVDTDPQGSLTSYFGFEPEQLRYSVYSFFEESQSRIKLPVQQVVQKTRFDNIDLLPAVPAMATLDRQLINRPGMGLVLSQAISPLVRSYDRVLFDCAPALGVLLINALGASRELVIPVQTEHLAIKGLERMLKTLAMVNRVRKQPLPYVVLPTFYDSKIWACVEALQSLQQRHADRLAPKPVPFDPQLKEASRKNTPLSLLNSDADSIDAYKALLTVLQRPEDLPATRPTRISNNGQRQ